MKNKNYRSGILCWLLLIVFAGSPATAQRNPRVIRTDVQPNWSPDGDQVWYRIASHDRKRQFVVVEVKSGKRQTIDGEKLAAALAEKTQKKVAPNSLNLQALRLGNAEDNVQLCFQSNWYELNLESYQLQETGAKQKIQSPYFLPGKASVDLGGETQFRIDNQRDADLDVFWIDRNGSPQSYGKIAAGKALTQHTFFGHVWLIKSQGKTLCALQVTQSQVSFTIDKDVESTVKPSESKSRQPHLPRRTRGRGASSPDGAWQVVVDNHNLLLKNNDHNEQHALTTDGSESNSFTADASRGRLVQMAYNKRNPAAKTPTAYWSGDSKYVLAVQTKTVDERRVHYIESSPRNQIQPQLRNYPYAKPGDELPTPTFRLFSVESQTEIAIDRSLMENPFQIRFLHWNEDFSSFYLYFNQRGHQAVRILKVDVADGKVSPIVEETSETFVHYSAPGKSTQRWLANGELLWASERSGWNHLYRIDSQTGSLLNPVTSGDWNVKRIYKIDTESQTIWFYAVGVFAGQDPYHEHFCRVQFDGTGFVLLTDGDGTHNVTFSPDESVLVDRYSRVDMPTVTELRSATDGSLLCVLEKGQFIKASPPKINQIPKRFTAKGRDGKTDIYGIIHFPKDFDPQKSYPIVENIYAGPHDHHVPKAYGGRFSHQRGLTDRGMFVVQIDGMGTAWRSKEFHDHCYKNLRDAGFPDRIAWITAAAKEYPQMDLKRVGIYGGSAGGQNAMAALLWHNDFYSVAVADCGCHDNRMDKIWWNEQWMGWPVDDSYSRSSNVDNAHLLKGHLMLVVGELDRNVDPASTTQVVDRLIKADIDFDFVLVAGAGHGACETRWASRKRAIFLARHLNAEGEDRE